MSDIVVVFIIAFTAGFIVSAIYAGWLGYDR